MEVINSIVYIDPDSYNELVKDPFTLYLVSSSTLVLYFREMKLSNVVYSEVPSTDPSPDCFYISDNCLYYVCSDQKTIFKLFDSTIAGINKLDDRVELDLNNGSKRSAVTIDENYDIYPEKVRSQIISKVGDIDLTVDWDKWG